MIKKDKKYNAVTSFIGLEKYQEISLHEYAEMTKRIRELTGAALWKDTAYYLYKKFLRDMTVAMHLDKSKNSKYAVALLVDDYDERHIFGSKMHGFEQRGGVPDWQVISILTIADDPQRIENLDKEGLIIGYLTA